MNVKEVYKDFLNKTVDIGIPHYVIPGKLFFITGNVIDLEEVFLVLKIKNGIRKIPYSDIIQIKESNGGYYDR